MAPTLYYMDPSPPVRSVLLTAKALGVEFDLKPLNLFAGEHKKPINPQHTIPTLVEEDGFILWDSHAITPYLIGKYAKNYSLYPKDIRKRAIVDQILHFNNSVLRVRFALPAGDILFSTVKQASKEHVDGLKEAYGFLETFLDGNQYFAGNQLTIADLHIVATLTTAEVFLPVSPLEFPMITAWLNRMKALPNYKEANEKGLKMCERLINAKRA